MSYIELSNLSFYYRKGKALFDNISLTFNLGEQVGIIGRNGAGKTTLVKLLIGMLKPQKGTISIEGSSIKNKSIADVATKVGFVFQNPNQMLFTNTVEKELELSLMRFELSKEVKQSQVNKILDFFDMDELRTMHPRNLSRGEKQKLALATVLVQEPQAIILDEPFSGIDMTQRLLIVKYLNELKKQGKLIILVSHNLDLILETTDKIIALKEGKVAYNMSIVQFFQNSEHLKEIGLIQTDYLSMLKSLKKFGLPNEILKKDDLLNFYKESLKI
ncbi:MAG: ABC transporter ATP-binding protein [Candidatus Heimdallarchaeota archaeon]